MELKMKNKIYALVVLLMSIMVLPVNAKSLDAFQAGENVKLQKNIDSTTFVAGQKLEVTSEIKGMIFAAAQKAKMSGSNDYAFIAGQDVEIDEMETKDAFIAGQNITITSSSIRDLFVAGERIEINSDISRNVYVAGQNIIISGEINGDVYTAAESIKLEKGAEITGTLHYAEDTNLKENGAHIGKKDKYESAKLETERETTIVTYIMGRIKACLSMIILAMIGLYIAKPFFQKLGEKEKSMEVLMSNVGIGVGVLFVTPILALIGLIISAFVLMIPFPVIVLGLIAYGLAIYLAAIPFAYYLGDWFLKDKITNDYARISAAIAILYIVRIVPIIGGFTSFVMISFGLGVYFKSIFKKKKSK